jgi:ATP-binding cassette subfamily F protein 3
MERLERPQDDPQLRFIMEPKLVTGEQLLMVENLAFGYKGVEPVASNAPTHVSTTPPKLALNPPLAIARSQATDGLLFDDLGFQLFRGERLGITGPNGCGKTTLLKLLGRLLAPVRGMIAWGANAELGIYSQDSIDLHPDNDAMSELRSVEPRINDSDARDYLGRFGFSGDDVFQPVHSLSGGERSRLSLAKVFRRRPNVLLLDEPTNHLDIYAREGLEQFLTGYRGSIVMVTHDRRLLERICDRIVAFEQQAGRDGALTTSVSFFRGSYGDYRQWLAGRGTAAATDNGSRSAVSGSGRANPDDPASLSLYDIEALARDNRTSPAGYINKQRERYLRAAEKLEDAIAALEKQGDTLRSEMEQAAEQQEYTTLAELQARLDDLTAESEAMFDKLEIELGQAEAWEKLATEQGISL